MTIPLQDILKQLSPERLAAIEARANELIQEQQEEEANKWPLKSSFNMHGDHEAAYQQGLKLGLRGRALDKFSLMGYEVHFDIEVLEDGSTYATHVNGVALTERVSV